MIEDFRVAIGTAWMVKQQMMELDKDKIWPYHLPAVAATEQEIADAENHIGRQLDQRYKAFLRCANGWPAFYQTVDLFGTTDLVPGPRYDNGQFMLSMLDDGVLARSAVSRTELLPIAATTLDRDLFVMTRSLSGNPGPVIWFAGEEIERFATFDESFLSMTEFNRVATQRFREQKS